MDGAYRWFLGLLGAIGAILAAIYILARLGFLRFSLQLCGKNGSCTTYPNPLSYLGALAGRLAFAGALVAVASVAGLLLARRTMRRSEQESADRPLR